MFVVLVTCTLKSGMKDKFLPLALANAHRSLTDEFGCRQFDVCRDLKVEEKIILYELYDGRSAFDAHLATDHFKSFDIATRDMIFEKVACFMERIN
jgi:quinol monooxygenase YgiN